MRGGALPLLCWALLLTLIGTLNAVWTGDTIQMATFASALLAVLIVCAILIVRSRGEAIRRGAPGPRRSPRAIVRTSAGAVLLGTGIAVFVFGFAFGHFPIYFGAGMMITGAARLVLEQRAQRRALQQAVAGAEDDRRPSAGGSAASSTPAAGDES